jgi:hypothetical protein
MVVKAEGYPGGSRLDAVKHKCRWNNCHGILHPHDDEMQVPEWIVKNK